MCYDIVTFHEQLHGSDIYLLPELHKSVYSYYLNYKNDVFLDFSPLHTLTYFPTWKLKKLKKKIAVFISYMRNRLYYFLISSIVFYDLFFSITASMYQLLISLSWAFPHDSKLNKRFSYLLDNISKNFFLRFICVWANIIEFVNFEVFTGLNFFINIWLFLLPEVSKSYNLLFLLEI